VAAGSAWRWLLHSITWNWIWAHHVPALRGTKPSQAGICLNYWLYCLISKYCVQFNRKWIWCLEYRALTGVLRPQQIGIYSVAEAFKRTGLLLYFQMVFKSVTFIILLAMLSIFLWILLSIFNYINGNQSLWKVLYTSRKYASCFKTCWGFRHLN